MKRIVGTLGLSLALTSQSFAFADLIEFAAILPDGIETPYVFDYAAPQEGFAAGTPTFGSDAHLANALRQAASPDPVTGVDFSQVTGVLTVGDPPATITVLFGNDGFDAGTVATLEKREFEPSEVEGVPVLARGDDYAIDTAQAGEPDPFAGGMGKSQRIALGGNYLMRTAGWPEMRAALTALPRPSDSDNLWAALFEGLRASAGHDSHLDAASGWSVAAFFDPGPGVEFIIDPAAVMKSKSKPVAPPTAEPVVFPFALFGITRTETGASLSLALPFGEDKQALDAAEAIADRLVLHPFTPSRPSVDVQYMEPYSVAVISLPFDNIEDARTLYGRWMGDIYQRNFQPLMLGL